MTSTRRTPCSITRRAADSAASCAANGVDLRLPLNPTLPDDDQANTLPDASVIDTMVLLNELLMWATPNEMFLRSFLRGRRPPGFGFASSYFLGAFFLPATVFLGPFRVRALVWVR